MDASVVLFGHSVPLSDPVLAGLPLRDVTRLAHKAPANSRIIPLLEPFLDPFVQSFLLGLETGAFAGAALIVLWRHGAGALHAYRYATELRRLGLLPEGAPLHLWNRASGDSAAVQAFNAQQDARLAQALARLTRGAPLDRNRPLATLEAMQAAGSITAEAAFARRLRARALGIAVDTAPGPAPKGPRLALAGAPLGGCGLHAWLDRQGALVLDLQGPDAPEGDVTDLLQTRGVEALVWQVDPHDDLHGWHKPALMRLCADLGVRFVDLGFVPTWPQPHDLPKVLP